MSADHSRYMRIALALARRNLGQAWPNPSVGALVVKDGQIIGQGYTAKGGRPHAETQALEQAGEIARGATLYVTLEPCSHHGKTPPCTDAIISAGIAHCTVACRDPNPQVNGQGIERLARVGIDIIEGVCEREARDVNRGFFSVIERNRPYVALKIATSLDGRITAPGSRWITGVAARHYGHLLRSQYDAIATGIGTVLADDPLLTCRLPGLEDRSPVRVVFDSKLRLPEDCQLVRTADKVPLWVLSSSRRRPGSTPPHIRLLEVDAETIDLSQALRLLAQQGITRLLIEGGAKLITAFLNNGLADRIYWFRAPVVIGEGGLAAIDGEFSGLARYRPVEHIGLSPDSLDILECSPAS